MRALMHSFSRVHCLLFNVNRLAMTGGRHSTEKKHLDESLDAQLLEGYLQCACGLRRARHLVVEHESQLLVQLVQVLVVLIIHLGRRGACVHV